MVIGDVEQGARITAKGNVIVLGELKGTVVAGASGNQEAVIVALTMAPYQLRIAEFETEVNEKGRRLGRRPVTASVEDQRISLTQIKKSFFDVLKSV